MTSSVGKGLTIPDLAESFLLGVQQHFAAANVALPARQYVAAGLPANIAWDCEQLVVALTGIGWGQAEDVVQLSPQINAQASVAAVRHAVFSVQLVRCTPAKGPHGALPTVDQIHENGLAFFRDAGLLSQALVTACTRVAAMLGLQNTGNVQPGAVEPLGPTGGLVALDASVAITAGALG